MSLPAGGGRHPQSEKGDCFSDKNLTMLPPQDQPSHNLPAITNASLPPVRQERGGVVGNKGGLGRVPTRVRRKAREGFDRLIPRFIAIANGQKVMQTVTAVGPNNVLVTADVEVIPPIKDQVKVFDLLGKYGLGENISADDVRARLLTQCAVIREELGLENGEVLIERLSKVWR